MSLGALKIEAKRVFVSELGRPVRDGFGGATRNVRMFGIGNLYLRLQVSISDAL